MKPVYAENLVVGIIHDRRFEWYILEREACYMDLYKLERANHDAGYEVNFKEECRLGIKVVNRQSMAEFLKRIQPWRTSVEKLRTLLKAEDDFDERLGYNPSLLMDFDHEVLYSYYPEPASFEHYVPDGWQGKYMVFDEYIPAEQRYWLDEQGNDLIGG